MHARDVPRVPGEAPGRALAELRDDARWIRVALPGHAAAVRAVLDILERHAPAPPPRPAFCHGDLTPSQMLVDGDHWAITDFDGARIGDAHRDLAIWLASLPLEATARGPGAELAYHEGYGAHDERRLRWWRAAAEVHYVAVALKKDRHDEERAERALRVARACAQDVR
jgi:aminoglycoside phosphotransferase (APT) family kinase protein